MHPTREAATRKRVLICGGRDLVNRVAFGHAMSIFIQCHGRPRMVIHGAAGGADTMAGEWAREEGIQVVAVPANWKGEGKSAGPKRNQLMLDLLEPDIVVAFPGGTGTADMVRRAKEAGIFIFEA